MQTDSLNLPDSDGQTYRLSVNEALQAVATGNAGSSAPPDTYPYMEWLDTSVSPHVLKRRNATNNAWEVVPPSNDPDNLVDATLNGTERVAVKQSGNWKRADMYDVVAAGVGTVSVMQHGADATGVADSAAAFSAAAQAAFAQVILTYENINLDTPMAPVAVVRVPAGLYKLTSLVNTGNREIVWVFDSAATLEVNSWNNLQGRVHYEGQRITSRNHYGTRDYACGFSVIANNNLNASAGVLGFSDPSNMGAYSDRDSVGMYVENNGPALVATLVAPSYTATSVSCPTPVTTSLLRKGMIIDTAHSPKWSGMITSWAGDGSSINVEAWYLVDGNQNAGTPANGVNAYVNAITKVWANNSNVFLKPNSHASSAAGFELGCFNNKAQPGTPGASPKVWGFDAVNLGTYKCEAAFIARPGTENFFYGFQSQFNDVSFFSETDGVAFKSVGDGTILDARTESGDQVALITNSGAMELGRTATAAPVYIDFHSSGNAVDYDSRILATGGSGTSGQGTITDYARVRNFISGSVGTPHSYSGYDKPGQYIEFHTNADAAPISIWGNTKKVSASLVQAYAYGAETGEVNGVAARVFSGSTAPAGAQGLVGMSALAQSNAPAGTDNRDVWGANFIAASSTGNKPENIVGIEVDVIPSQSATTLRPDEIGADNFTGYWAQSAGGSGQTANTAFFASGIDTGGWNYGMVMNCDIHRNLLWLRTVTNAQDAKGIRIETQYQADTGRVMELFCGSNEQMRVDGDANNPVWIRIGGVLKQVVQGAADSAGTGYRALRVTN